ncbi:universal stress protein [Owenweeksia hongkongensis]|uniref:universal stress protein n=1 Tax=Owenweeksia hongkongensis TaxID=253245 RepID=UPI003A937BC1
MKFLVPYDFSAVTKAALDYSIMLSKSFPGEIEVLHIIESEDQRKAAEDKLEQIITSLKVNSGTVLTQKVRVGNILEDINMEANEGHAQLLVMGTHGSHGLQKLLGSNAIRIITNSKTPFVITQSKAVDDIKNIVIPVDLTKERMQILRFATLAAAKFNARVHLVCKAETDEFLMNKLNNNIQQAKSYLSKEGVSHEVHLLAGKKSLQDEVMDYGYEIGTDLFAIAHYPKGILPQFDSFSQAMITNPKEVPVLIVNASEITGVRAQYSFIGI